MAFSILPTHLYLIFNFFYIKNWKKFKIALKIRSQFFKNKYPLYIFPVKSERKTMFY